MKIEIKKEVVNQFVYIMHQNKGNQFLDPFGTGTNIKGVNKFRMIDEYPKFGVEDCTHLSNGSMLNLE